MTEPIKEIKKIKNGWLVVVEWDNETNFYIVKMSKRKGKKYDVFNIKKNKDGKYKLDYKLSFGSSKYQHYKDKLGGYDELDHNDKERLENFRARFKDWKEKSPNSATFWSARLLW